MALLCTTRLLCSHTRSPRYHSRSKTWVGRRRSRLLRVLLSLGT